jgi:hypothetical protein
VVVCQRLAGGSRVFGRMARSGQVRDLGRGLGGLIHDVLSYRTCAAPSQYLGWQMYIGGDGSHTIGEGVEGGSGICRGAIVSPIRATERSEVGVAV